MFADVKFQPVEYRTVVELKESDTAKEKSLDSTRLEDVGQDSNKSCGEGRPGTLYQSYQRLKADVNVGMQDFRCRTVILCLLKEQPKFKHPTKLAMRAYSGDERDTFDNAIYKVGDDQPFGPYLYNAHSWFGTLTPHLSKIYRRDPNTGVIAQPYRKYLIRDGRMELQGDNADLGLIVGDLFPSEEDDIEGIHSEPIYLKIGWWRSFSETEPLKRRDRDFSTLSASVVIDGMFSQSIYITSIVTRGRWDPDFGVGEGQELLFGEIMGVCHI
ncbi:hypothetical protein V1527DRAFT_486583 [Lipomyces starkeyi]